MSRLKLIGANIKKFRELKKLSQECLAENVNLSREYIVRVENGQKYVSLKRLFLIADVLQVPLKNIVDVD